MSWSKLGEMRFVLVSVWCVSLALSITAAQDAAVTNASQIADKLGQPVEFQDEVKAVSYSRSTKGYYLSFGAPYPKQTLSVCIGSCRTKAGRLVGAKAITMM